MRRQIKILVLSCFLSLVFLTSLILFGGKPAPVVELRATFEAISESGLPSTILNDAQGPYVTDGVHNISVWFTSDNGELFFKLEHHCDRSALVIFPPVYVDCGGYLPDTAEIYLELPDEPVDFFRFKTYNSPAFAGPRINFLQMTPGVPKQVRLWTTICTTQRHYFVLNYNNTDPNKISGVVEVTAYDDNGDGTLDRWVMSPVLGSGDMATILKHPEKREKEICNYGTHLMPFKLVLERLK